MLKKLNTFINKRGKKLFYTEVLIALVLLSMPLWFMWSRTLPNVKFIESYWFTLSSFGFDNIQSFIYLLLIKLCAILVLTFWFFTCQYWWRYALLVPLIFAIAQFLIVFITEKEIDRYEFWIAMIISLPVILLMVSISNRIVLFHSNQILINDIKNEVTEILQSLSSDSVLDDIADEFEILKDHKFKTLEEEYLTELILLRNKIVAKLESK